MKKYFLIAMILVLSGCGSSETPLPVQKQEKKPVTQEKVQKDDYDAMIDDLFIYEEPPYNLEEKIQNPKIALVVMEGTDAYVSGKGEMFGCNDKIVEYALEKELTPTEALNKLFSGENPQDNSYYNVFENSKNLKVESLEINDKGELEMELSGEIITSGTCDSPRPSAQITQTLWLLGLPIENYHIRLNGKDFFEVLADMDDVR